MSGHSDLPIESLRPELLECLGKKPVVVTAPTGSGKSTQVPRWCVDGGKVLVVEPRRVACRGLAARVAELEGCELGRKVGYSVRDDNRTSPATEILFATPGVVLAWLAGGTELDFGTVILDEFHERRLDVDLIMALLMHSYDGRLAVMSATLDGDRVAGYLGGVHLSAEGRQFPVTARHLPGEAFLPDVRGLEDRLRDAVRAATEIPGDLLVFLPGKGEIAKAARTLAAFRNLEVLQVHGGLTLKEQSRIFQPGSKRRVILSTNVAETSITIPGVGVVVDSGLVRRTRYHNGRGYLTLVPVAADSAQQRAGRAGRTAPGVCFRLWSNEARLTETTPPEMRRESLVPLVLAAASCGVRVDELEFLDPPADFAVASAVGDLTALGALDERGVTERGRSLFSLPLDPFLGNLLVEAKGLGALDDAVDLAAGLSGGRQMFTGRPRSDEKEDDLKASGCDAVAIIRAVREGQPARHGLSRFSLQEARAARKRLRQAFGLKGAGAATDRAVDRKAVALAALRADSRCAYIARRRKKGVAWANGGTEVMLARESAVDENKVDALAALEVRAIGVGHRKTTLLAGVAMPLPLPWLVEAGLGEDSVGRVVVEKGKALAVVERVYAGRVLEKREEMPEGELARGAIGKLFTEGRLYPEALAATADRLDALALYLRLRKSGLTPEMLNEPEALPADHRAVPGVEEWALLRLEELGVESGEDFSLLSMEDLLADDLPREVRSWLDRVFPRRVDLGDAVYRVIYDLGMRKVTLERASGQRKSPPLVNLLPAFGGFGIKVKHGSRTWVLR